MFSFFKRRGSKGAEATCNERIREFWDWFQEMAPEFRKTIDDGRCDDLTDITSRKVDELFPGFAWAYGAGSEGVGHSFTLSGEGVEHRQFLALHWLACAPQIEGWTFYAARQPGNTSGAIIIGETRFEAKGMWVTPTVDEEEERIDVTIWHPEWPKMEERSRWTVVFLFLDEALGEYGTKWWIGEIRLGDDRLADSFPLSELPAYVRETSDARNWKKYPPGEAHTLFQLKPPEKSYARGDLMTLSTLAHHLFYDYQEAEGRLEDPFAGTGADYVYVRFAKEHLERGKEIDQRGALEDALDLSMRNRRSGWCIGGGHGTRYCYVDLLIFDGRNSLDLIVEVLNEHHLPKGTTIEYFAKEKRSQTIRL